MKAQLTQRGGGFAAVGDRIAARAPQAVTDSAYDLADKVRSNIRDRAYDTGRLHNSVNVQPAGRGATAEVTAGDGLDYPEYVENGTIYMWPRRYFGDAVAAHQSEFGRTIAAAIASEMG